MEKIIVRPVREHEWREVRSLRLRALQDEVARIAFVDTFEEASSRPDDFWQARAAGASLEARSDAAVRQFVAVTEGGTWIGSATVIIEHAGDKDFLGRRRRPMRNWDSARPAPLFWARSALNLRWPATPEDMMSEPPYSVTT